MAAQANGILILLDGLPFVDQASQAPLRRFLLRKLGDNSAYVPGKVYIPVDTHGMSLGLAVVRINTNEEALQCIADLNNTPIDGHHTMFVERVAGSERYRGVQAQGVVDQAAVNAIVPIQRPVNFATRDVGGAGQ